MKYTVSADQLVAAIMEILDRDNRAEIVKTKDGVKVYEITRRKIELNKVTHP